jgi:2-hydroxy-6-oxonona-2,4-dienedioate hydrolase
MPANATPAAQADALAALLDALDIGQIDVISLSAGATSALQLALRHPETVKHLAVLVGNLPGSPTAVVQPSWVKLSNQQLPIWALKTFAPTSSPISLPRAMIAARSRWHHEAPENDGAVP